MYDNNRNQSNVSSFELQILQLIEWFPHVGHSPTLPKLGSYTEVLGTRFVIGTTFYRIIETEYQGDMLGK